MVSDLLIDLVVGGMGLVAIGAWLEYLAQAMRHRHHKRKGH